MGGLPRAFIAAGAKSVLATMWATQDESAPVLLKAWHKAVKEEPSQAKALRASILAMQAEAGGQYKHPVHWAGFTCSATPRLSKQSDGQLENETQKTYARGVHVYTQNTCARWSIVHGG